MNKISQKIMELVEELQEKGMKEKARQFRVLAEQLEDEYKKRKVFAKKERKNER
jgi:gas vesicle protein